MAAAAEIMANEFGPSGIDFIDINCGCPIDLIFKSGSGSACMRFLHLFLAHHDESNEDSQCSIRPANLGR